MIFTSYYGLTKIRKEKKNNLILREDKLAQLLKFDFRIFENKSIR